MVPPDFASSCASHDEPRSDFSKGMDELSVFVGGLLILGVLALAVFQPSAIVSISSHTGKCVAVESFHGHTCNDFNAGGVHGYEIQKVGDVRDRLPRR